MGWFDAIRRSLFGAKNDTGGGQALTPTKAMRKAEKLREELAVAGEATTTAGRLEMQMFLTRYFLPPTKRGAKPAHSEEAITEFLYQSAEKLGLDLTYEELETIYRARTPHYDREVAALRNNDTKDGAALVYSYVTFYKEPLEIDQQYYAIRANYLKRELKEYQRAIEHFFHALGTGG